jgi:hypothetical protein
VGGYAGSSSWFSSGVKMKGRVCTVHGCASSLCHSERYEDMSAYDARPRRLVPVVSVGGVDSIEPRVVDLQLLVRRTGVRCQGVRSCAWPAAGKRIYGQCMQCSFVHSLVLCQGGLYVPASSRRIPFPFPISPALRVGSFPFFKFEDKEMSRMTTLRPLHLINNNTLAVFVRRLFHTPPNPLISSAD